MVSVLSLREYTVAVLIIEMSMHDFRLSRTKELPLRDHRNNEDSLWTT